jgi:uncharacterized protein YnzC (UPF0291/DUF896 family)
MSKNSKEMEIKLLKEIVNSIKRESYIKEFKKDLRYAFKNMSLNSYGKLPNELTKEELKVVLDKVLKDYYHYFISENKEQKREEYLNLFRETFKNEIKKISEENLEKANEVLSKNQ